MSNPQSDNRLPIYQRLRDHLAARINSREWRPGDAIPTEVELAQAHRVAIGTVRKAIDLLVAEGRLERKQGRGTFVKRTQFNSTLFRFFRFQSELGERHVPESRILQMKVLSAPLEVASALGISKSARVIAISRLRLIEANPVLAEEIWLDASRFAALLSIPTADFGDLLYPLYEERCGQIVNSADETITVSAASALQARLLARTPGSPLIVIERVAFDANKCPIEWRRSRGPADKFHYRIEIK